MLGYAGRRSILELARPIVKTLHDLFRLQDVAAVDATDRLILRGRMSNRLGPRPEAVLAVLCDVCDRQGTDEIVYASEWLGWLPFGAYHWIDIGKEMGIESRFPNGWERADLDELVDAGCLDRLEVVESGPVPADVHITYRLTARGRSAVAGKTA
jgi:hypothetical protein